MKAAEILTKARTSLILDQPFYASLLLKMQMQEDRSTKTAWIDGKSIGYNPAWIETLPIEEVKGILAHEIEHVIFRHHLRRNGRDIEIWNNATDYSINSILQNAGFRLPANMLFNPSFSGQPSEQIFNTLWGKGKGQGEDASPDPQQDGDQEDQEEKQEPGSTPGDSGDGEEEQDQPGDQPGENDDKPGDGDPGNQPGDSPGNTPGDQPGNDQQGKGNGDGKQQQPPPDLPPGEVRDYPGSEAEKREAEADLKITIQQAYQYSKSHGKSPAHLEKAIAELLNPALSWKEILARFIDTASRNDYTFTRPNARYIGQGFFLPSLHTPEIGRLALAVDVSGSISQSEVIYMVSEIQGILSAYPGTELTVIFCNAYIQGEPEALQQNDELTAIPMPGGGTDFRPPFTWIKENQLDPKAIIYFTDGECNCFPEEEPEAPVLWVLTQDPTCYPWNPPTGETVKLDPADRQP